MAKMFKKKPTIIHNFIVLFSPIELQNLQYLHLTKVKTLTQLTIMLEMLTVQRSLARRVKKHFEHFCLFG